MSKLNVAIYEIGNISVQSEFHGGMEEKLTIRKSHQCTPYTKINSRWIKDLNTNRYIIKVLEENIGRKISDIPCSNIFTDMSPRARDIKERINKWAYIKFKKIFCMAKESISKMKKEPTEWEIWENIFANDTSDKGLISKIYKELTRVHPRKTNSPIKKWAKNLNRHFSKEDIQRVQRHVKMCSASVAIRKIQITTTNGILLHSGQNIHN